MALFTFGPFFGLSFLWYYLIFRLPDDAPNAGSVANSDTPNNVKPGDREYSYVLFFNLYPKGLYKSWEPAYGYKWLSDDGNDYRVVWSPSTSYSGYTNVIAGTREGEWKPTPGYGWVDDNNKRTDWIPGALMPGQPNVQASPEEGLWIPAPGYKWLNDSKDSFEVVQIVQKPTEYAH